MNYNLKIRAQQNHCTKQDLKNLLKKYPLDDELDDQSYDDICELVSTVALLLDGVGLKMLIRPEELKIQSQQNHCTKQDLKNLLKKYPSDEELDDESYEGICELVTSVVFLLDGVGLKMLIRPKS